MFESKHIISSPSRMRCNYSFTDLKIFFQYYLSLFLFCHFYQSLLLIKSFVFFWWTHLITCKGQRTLQIEHIIFELASLSFAECYTLLSECLAINSDTTKTTPSPYLMAYIMTSHSVSQILFVLQHRWVRGRTWHTGSPSELKRQA